MATQVQYKMLNITVFHNLVESNWRFFFLTFKNYLFKSLFMTCDFVKKANKDITSITSTVYAMIITCNDN